MTLTESLQGGAALRMVADVTHARRGPIRHSFRYRVDYVLMSPETLRPMGLLGRNRWSLWSFHDRDHGGLRGAGQGADWAWAQVQAAGLPRRPGLVMALLTQPRFLGRWFTPVSFWLVLEGDRLLAAIAEVNNTFGQRHSYLCHLPDFAPITPDQTIRAEKVFHVSPFQDVAGDYHFGFALSAGRLAIRIRQIDGAHGLDAAMSGDLRPLTNAGLLAASLLRPGGSLRVIALIYWHALRLKLKGARYRRLPPPPDQEIS